MKLFRTIEITADNGYMVGDIIAFLLTNGEEVEALAVKQEQDGMVFCLLDCLEQNYPMNRKKSDHGCYETSDLRIKLNSEIFDNFPTWIQKMMIPFANRDYLRLPTEREIFGSNKFGESETDEIEQWKPMKKKRNRVASKGKHTDILRGYWLQNRHHGYGDCFACTDHNGFGYYCGANYDRYVRPVFKMQNKASIKLSRVIETTADNGYMVGDVIAFSLTDREKVEALAVKQERDSMVFCLLDCLRREYPMNVEDDRCCNYAATDLRMKLNGGILGRFPDGIRKKMIVFENGDYLRLPTGKEIWGCDALSEIETDDTGQWEPMKKYRNRIASQGKGSDCLEWYWLQDSKDSTCPTAFDCVDNDGFRYWSLASFYYGVRPVFKLKNG